jgi:hypothetical protein
MASAEGRLSLARERRKVRIHSKALLIVPTPHLNPLPSLQGRGDKERIKMERSSRQAQYPVARSTQNPFKLCDFQLVTLIAVLY